jgi:hypothetical protein
MNQDDFDETENHYLNGSPMDESINHRAESYHLEDLSNQVIEEKAEEEETSTVQVYTNNRDNTEGFNTNFDCEISDDDAKIMDEASISRRSINSSLINIKRTKMFGVKSEL